MSDKGTTQKVWYLYSQESEKRFDELSFLSAVKILDENISYMHSLDSWMAWKEGMNSWVVASNISEFKEALKHKPQKEKKGPPPLPEIKLKVKVEPPPLIFEPQIDTRRFEQRRFETRRRYERYSIRLRVVIFKGDQTFRTYTKDLSEGGMLLENKVPESFLNGQCEIFIGSPNLKENIQFVGEVIGDSNNPHRFAFVEKGENSVQRMAQWFNLFNALKHKKAS